MVDLDGFKQFLTQNGFEADAVQRIADELVSSCPWILKPEAQIDDATAEARFHELEEFFVKHGLSIHDLLKPQVDGDRWNLVYEGVVRALEPFGDNNALGEGDFWVVEDFYGTPEILVEVNNEQIAIHDMKQALSRFLKQEAPDFCVIIRKVSNPDRSDEVVTAR